MQEGDEIKIKIKIKIKSKIKRGTQKPGMDPRLNKALILAWELLGRS
jgi:hypothetical protein